MTTCSRPGDLRTADWLQDELPPGNSSLHDSIAIDCVCTLWSSAITQADIENRRSNWVNARDRQCYDDVGNAWRLQIREWEAEQPRAGLIG